ncbi:gamma-tubulin complex component, putative [Plasmodium vivax]|nr:gamma-tubulin complex component, putative [Plasmodium vivax]
MTSTYITEIRKKQRDYLSCLFSKFEKYSNEKVLTNLINKSLNEIALYPFQDVSDNEVIDDVNEYINELTINAEYKRKKIFKHLCEIFLNDNFYVYDKKDRYELKFVILKLLFLIGESKTSEGTQHIDHLYGKYFHKKEAEEVAPPLNINEQNALNDIHSFNLQEETKYLKELYDTDDEITRLSSLSGEGDIQIDDPQKEESLQYGHPSDVYNQLANYQEQPSGYSGADPSSSHFHEAQYTQYVDSYMKNKNDLTYENVVKKISQCVYEYPHYEDLGGRWRRRERTSLQSSQSVGCLDNVSSYDHEGEHAYNVNVGTKAGRRHPHRRISTRSSSTTSDEDILATLKMRKNKSKGASLPRRPREQYFFSNINLFDEEHHESEGNDASIIYETEIYNLHNVFVSDTGQERHEEAPGEIIGRKGHPGGNALDDNSSGCRYTQWRGPSRYAHRSNEGEAPQTDGLQNECNIVLADKGNIIKAGTATRGRKNKRKGTFYVSEIFIIKEILMMLSLNCPIKFKEDFFTNFSDFLFNHVMDKNKIKEDFLFYINIERREKGEGSAPHAGVTQYRAVISQMMNVKQYHLRRRAFKNYVKKIKKVSIKLFYLNIFFFLVEKFRYFFFFLPYNLRDIFNHIIHIREHLSCGDGKNSLSLLFEQMSLTGRKGSTQGSTQHSTQRSSHGSSNVYYPGNFLQCFIDSLKCIYSEWICVVEILYNYHILLVMKQYNIAPVRDEQILDFLNRMDRIRVMDYLRVDHFVNWKRRKRVRQPHGKAYTPGEITPFEELHLLEEAKADASCHPRRNRWDSAKRLLDEQKIASFRSLSLIHLQVIMSKYLYVWNNLYDYVDFMLSYLLYNIGVDDYTHFNALYDNAKKFCTCYDMTVLYWRNCQIVNNKSLEKIFRFLLNGLNVYYSKHISNWIKKGKIDDAFNEFFVYSQDRGDEGPFANHMLFVKKQGEFVLCPEFFNSFVFFLISLGNNIRLYMKISHEKEVDYVDYYLKGGQEPRRMTRHAGGDYQAGLDEVGLADECSGGCDGEYSDESDGQRDWQRGWQRGWQRDWQLDDERADQSNAAAPPRYRPKRLHKNTLNYYYNIESLRHAQNTSLDIISAILTTRPNEENLLPYFNKTILALNVSYDLYIKKFLEEEFFHLFLQSNRIFLDSLMKYSYLLEYFCCLRSLVFLEIADFIAPFFEFIFKEVSIPLIDERNMNTTFRQCVVQNVNSPTANVDGSNSCASFLHKRFVLLHMNILMQKNSHRKKGKGEKMFEMKQGDDPTGAERDGLHYPNGEAHPGEEKRQVEITAENGEVPINVSPYAWNCSHPGDPPPVGKVPAQFAKKGTVLSYPSGKGQRSGKYEEAQWKIEPSICKQLTQNFYKEEIITSILKRFYFTLRENKMYNNNIRVISYRNLLIETRGSGSSFVSFLFDSKCLEKYSTIFSFFLEIKKSLHVLNLVHIFYKYLRTKKSEQYECVEVIVTSLCLLKYKTFFFLNTLYTYYQWILSFSWNQFISTLLKSKSLYQIKHSHQLYLNFLIETMLVPIRTRHDELHNFYINDEHRKNVLLQEYESKKIAFNPPRDKNDQGETKMDSYNLWGSSTVALEQNSNCHSGGRFSQVAHNTDKYRRERKRSDGAGATAWDNPTANSLLQGSPNKQFLLNELFSNNLLNLLSIPSQIYDILLKLSKLFNVSFDLNFDNSYDMTFQSELEMEDDAQDEEDDPNEDDEEEIMNVKKGLINRAKHTVTEGGKRMYPKNGQAKSDGKNPADRGHILFSIKSYIKNLADIFDIHYLEFVMKLNVISLNVDQNSFFGPNRDSRLFNHILRLDKSVLRKVAILQCLLSFHSFSADPADAAHS